MAPKPSNSTIVVIGAGIIGLTIALKLQELLSNDNKTNSTRVLLVAREWPTTIPHAYSSSVNYASMWAGAHVRPIPATTTQLRREAVWLKQTAQEFASQLKAKPWAGISETAGVEFIEAPNSDYASQTAETFTAESGLSGYRQLISSEKPAGVWLGFECKTYCVNAPLYCGYLLRKFVLRGGRTLRRDLKSEWEAFSLQNDIAFVVNASGMGFGDSHCFPTRGQTVLTSLNATKTVTKQAKDGSWSFIIPRGFDGGTIIGGTKEPGNWDSEPSLANRNRLLTAGRELVSYAYDRASKCSNDDIFFDWENARVITDVVGRRPSREGGMRVEIEEKSFGNGGKDKRIIHAYGAGGRGFEISWGVANEVAGLAKGLLEDSTSVPSKL